MSTRRLRILLLLLDDDFATRLPLARALRARGDEVLVMTPAPAQLPEGFTRIAWSLDRGSLHPVRELRALAEVVAAYRRWRPDLVHHVAHKPIVYGSIAALVCRVRAVNTVTGLGYVALAATYRARLLRRMMMPLLRWLLARPHARAIVQNHDDLAALGIVATVIQGSGVDLVRFQPPAVVPAAAPPIVVYAGRLLVEKGVRELVTAARILAARGVAVRVVLVGERDTANPGSIDAAELAHWVASGTVEHWRARRDMPAVLGAAAIVCVPSWGEGLPKVLLEAAACGRAIVTTDAPGCREVIRDGIEGRLVPPRDPIALADAIAELLALPELRAALGARARGRVEAGLGDAAIVARTLGVYEAATSTQPRAEAQVEVGRGDAARVARIPEAYESSGNAATVTGGLGAATSARASSLGLALRTAHRLNAIARRHVYRSAAITRALFGVPVAPGEDLSYFELPTLAMQRVLRRELRDGMRVLEVGTGPHALLARWAARHWRLAITATDIEPVGDVAGIDVRCTDMFDGVAERFDRVWFVPPTTPAAIVAQQLAQVAPAACGLLELRANGGPGGWEIVDRFLGGLRAVLAHEARGYVTINAAHVPPARIATRIIAHGLATLRIDRALTYATFVVT